MDSLTQIVLGAAVGEATLGRKLGNRAMLWGAIAGTIPDLDVLIGQFMSTADAVAFHRGISHSIFFAAFFSLIISYYTTWLYTNGHHKKQWFKILSTILGIGLMLFVSFILIFINTVLVGKTGVILAAVLCLGITSFLSYRLINNYYKKEQEDISLSWKQWYLLFFWSIFTHPILDSCTAYGTQLFAPFSNYRVAWNNISIVDPIYTLPFLLFLIIASFITRKSPRRQIYNWIGITLSSIYMLYTVYNKLSVDKIMEYTLEENKIAYNRYMTAPTIFNNILWSGTVETDSIYYFGHYSLLDEDKIFKLIPIDKNHNMISNIKDNKSIETIKWFSNNYYNITPISNDTLQVNDLRYGLRGSNDTNDPDSYIFRFLIARDKNGNYELIEELRPSKKEAEGMFETLFTRIKGI